MDTIQNPPDYRNDTVLPLHNDVKSSSWAVDAACSGNPGATEYRAIDLATGYEIFRFGPIFATNNIGEFLAIVHALALMKQQGITDKVIYSDSATAISWIKRKHCKTNLPRDERTKRAFEIITRAEQWLRTNTITVPIIKWDTRTWGEIPADYGRKK